MIFLGMIKKKKKKERREQIKHKKMIEVDLNFKKFWLKDSQFKMFQKKKKKLLEEFEFYFFGRIWVEIFETLLILEDSEWEGFKGY